MSELEADLDDERAHRRRIEEAKAELEQAHESVTRYVWLHGLRAVFLSTYHPPRLLGVSLGVQPLARNAVDAVAALGTQ